VILFIMTVIVTNGRLGATTFSIMTLSIMTLSITTFSIKTLSIWDVCNTQHN